MNAQIISIGDEVVSGQCLDTNGAWIAAQLFAQGLRVTRHVTVGDDLGAIVGAVRDAMTDSHFIVVTGGLGPTPDDITRQAVADALGQPLEIHDAALTQVEDFFAKLQRTMPVSNRRQAMVPKTCEPVMNPRGTAPGLVCRRESTTLFVLPGVPAEMRTMFQGAVEPELAAFALDGAMTLTKSIHTFGMSEASMGEILSDLMAPGRPVSVGLTAADAVITVRLVTRAPIIGSAEAAIAKEACEIRRRLGAAVFGEGEDTLQHSVLELLTAKGITIATAESCTGGLIAKCLTDVPGSSTCFERGFITYSDQSKTDIFGVDASMIESHGAVSAEVAQAMAAGCRSAAGTDLGLAVTGIAGPTGGRAPDKPIGLVFVALADKSGEIVKKHLFGQHHPRSEIRIRACKSALNMGRLRLMGKI